MKVLNTKVLPLLVAAIPFALTACSSIVRHPQVDGLKKIAIISLYTNQDIPKVGGGGKNGGGAAALGKMVKAAKGDESEVKPEEMNNRERLAKYALDKYHAALSRVPGWRVVPTETVTASSEYKAMGKVQTENRTIAAIGAFATALQQSAYNTPPRMWAMPFGKENTHTDPKKLAALCDKLGVDAVAVVEVDLAYDSSFAVLGTGSAVASVASATKIINKSGEFAVYFPDIAKAGNGNPRFESEQKMMMLGGRIFMSGETEVAFKQAIDKASAETTKVITEGLVAKK